ncbi:alpha/beta fold hydrolase [Croceicoccus ponticola]|uniref:Alpha/beta fold hydrolase n=1 Tax=Croceicoccus ponticola TaxID=2217664 RepID=A0A437GU48_9SPHN|nr:alpha/beta fold hydrolase [Croceicoccus ponticola]RVQ64841.1 alpha/beta fold hydrolase [Croceicoccus ponticola]
MSEPLELLDPEAIAKQVRLEVDRALKRNIKGLDFLVAERAEVGHMPKDALYRDGTAVLYRYRPLHGEIYRIPLLVVSPPSNRGYIFDLAKGQSFFEYLLQQGYDVYNLDWNPPRRDERGLGFDDYVGRFIPAALKEIEARTGEREISLAGYCAGGTLVTIYAAIEAREHLRNLITLATPIDFSHMHLFQTWADKRYFDVDLLVRELELIPPEIMLGAFDLARPANRTAGRVNLWTNMWNDEFVKSYRMFDRWAAETLPIPGHYFGQLVKDLMWENALTNGTLEVCGKTADLGRVTASILNIVAKHDHVVSHEATTPLMTMTSSTDREELVSKGGHVSLVAGPSAVRRLWPHIDEWLGRRST